MRLLAPGRAWLLARRPRACQRDLRLRAALCAATLSLALAPAALAASSDDPTAHRADVDGIGPRARVLFLRVEFPDQASARPWSDFTNDGKSGLIDRLVSYYDEVSLRRFQIQPIVSQKIYRLPRRKAAYVSRPASMIRDALVLAARPESDGERSLLERANPDVVFVFFAGPGAESDIRRERPGLPWSNAVSGALSTPMPDWHGPTGVVVAEDPMHGLSPFGVMTHEFGHVLGLPELYAPNKVHEGIGIWGLMGQGTWVGMGDSPPHPCAWSKLTLGWVDPIVIDRSQKVSLPAVEKSGQVVKIFAKGPDEPHEYFLIENRRRIGADRRVPGEGLLVWHVDERVASFRGSQDDALHKRVDLLTADSWPSHLDVGHTQGGNRGDAGDPWVARADGPGPKTSPDTGSYDGTAGRFAIRNVSPAGEVMTFDVVFDEASKTEVPAAP